MKAILGDIEVGYGAAGTGTPVVFVHGLAEDRQSWDKVREALSDYRTYAYDLRGHGETTLGRADGTLAQLGKDLLDFLDRVSGPAACVGYSLGGTVVLWAAATRPAAIRRAVVAGTSSVVGRRAGDFFEERIRTLRRDLAAFADDLRSDTKAQLVAAVAEADAVAGRRLAAIGDGSGYVNAACAMRRLVDEPLTPLLARIKCPVEVIGGEKDVFCPPKAADMLVGSLPKASYREIAGAGHLMSIDKPSAYAGAIKDSLERGAQT